MLRPGGRLVFLRNSTILVLAQDMEGVHDRLVRDYFGLHRIHWPDTDLIELQAPVGAQSPYEFVSSEWGPPVAERGDLGGPEGARWQRVLAQRGEECRPEPIRSELLTGEQILWTGQPRRDLLFGRRRSVQADFIGAIRAINKSIRRDGVGTLRFGNASVWGFYGNAAMELLGSWPGMQQATTFFDIDDADQVYRLVSRLRGASSST